jgi:hypothetical protein
MEGDMVVALASATPDGRTRFARVGPGKQALCRIAGRAFAQGERVRVGNLDLPQARHTFTLLGSQPDGGWGLDHGVNEHGVAAGCASLPPARSGPGSGLYGSDLVRLGLERSQTAGQAVDTLTQLLEQFGPCTVPGSATRAAADHAFLLADAASAFAVETAGRHWAYQEVRQVRALSTVRVIRQDWDRISHGLAQQAIQEGHWPADGSKLDVSAALGLEWAFRADGLRRWGRATLFLEQHNGRLDRALLRRFLCGAGAENESVASFSAHLHNGPGRLLTAWFGLGPPSLGLFFPLFLEGELPTPLSVPASWGSEALGQSLRRVEQEAKEDPERGDHVRATLGCLQARFDREVEEFAVEGAALRQAGEAAALQRQAGLFLQHLLERLEEALTGLVPARRSPLKGPHRFVEDSVAVFP